MARRIVCTLLCASALLAHASWAFASAAGGQVTSSGAEQPPPAPPAPVNCAPQPPGSTAAAIRVGQCIRATLGAGDPTLEGGVPYRDYRLTLGANEAVRIDMDAAPSATGVGGAFDTYLEVRGQDQERPLRANDDRADQPGSLNSSLVFAPTVAGDYIVRARSLGSLGGAFTLWVAPIPTAPVRTLTLAGDAVISTIEVNDPVAAGRHFEEYNLRLSRGDIVQVDMEATSPEMPVGTARLDPYLALSRGGTAEPFVTNDDRGDSLNARLSFVAPADDVYRIRAEGFDRTTGQYRIRASRLQRLPEVEQLAEDRAGGIWQDGSPATLRDGASVRYREFRFAGRSGERIQVDAESNLSTRVMIGRPDGTWFVERAGPAEPDIVRPWRVGDPRDRRTRAFAVLPADGTYILRMEVPAPREGSFRLRLSRAAMASPAAQPLSPGETASGRLGIDSGFTSGRQGGSVSNLYQLYSLPVRAGDRLMVRLESQDFDPVLEAGAMSVIGFAAAVYNDDEDGGTGLNSRLELHIETDGILYLRARSIGPEVGEGRFRLSVTPAAAPASPQP